jgi:hypothetical protein
MCIHSTCPFVSLILTIGKSIFSQGRKMNMNSYLSWHNYVKVFLMHILILIFYKKYVILVSCNKPQNLISRQYWLKPYSWGLNLAKNFPWKKRSAKYNNSTKGDYERSTMVVMWVRYWALVRASAWHMQDWYIAELHWTDSGCRNRSSLVSVYVCSDMSWETTSEIVSRGLFWQFTNYLPVSIPSTIVQGQLQHMSVE